jgi:hypothetical protein
MGNLWDRLAVWWQGKKTILGGCLVMAAGVAGVWFGKLDPVSGLGVVGVGMSIAGFSAKANRHQAELLTALQGVTQIGADERAGKSGQAILQDVNQVAGQLAPAATAYVSGLAPVQQAAASLHLSADTVQELAAAIQHLAGNSDGPFAVPFKPEQIGGPAK